MLERFLPVIKDPADYITALSLFRVDAPLTAEEAERLLAVYAKYLPDTEDPDYCKVCLAADLLPGRTGEDRAAFAPLELGDETLDALFEVKSVASGREDVAGERAERIVQIVRDGRVALPVRILLARAALDNMAASRDIAALREQVAALAQFLTGCGEETLERYTALVGEVKLKCRS